jgi:hypothetical protein
MLQHPEGLVVTNITRRLCGALPDQCARWFVAALVELRVEEERLKQKSPLASNLGVMSYRLGVREDMQCWWRFN